MGAEFVTVRTTAGYDVVDPVTGMVVGELERLAGVLSKPAWTGLVAIDAGGPCPDSAVRRTIYHPVLRSQHGLSTIKRMTASLWFEGRRFALAIRYAKATSATYPR